MQSWGATPTTRATSSPRSRWSARSAARPPATRPPATSRSDRLSVLIISDKLVTTRPLPADRRGAHRPRRPAADLVIDDPSISRSHALLTIGPPLALRDLGSANGTRVRDNDAGRRRDRRAWRRATSSMLGNATLIVQRRAPPVSGPAHLGARLLRGPAGGGVRARPARRRHLRASLRLHVSPAPQPPRRCRRSWPPSRARSDVVGEYGPEEIRAPPARHPAPRRRPAAIDRVAQNLRRRARGGPARAGLLPARRAQRRRAHPPRLAVPARTRSRPPTRRSSAAIVADRRMQDLYRLAERIAAGNISVLILGETGVGKEVLAERVHRLSPRSAKPFLKLNCAALSETPARERAVRPRARRLHRRDRRPSRACSRPPTAAPSSSTRSASCRSRSRSSCCA